MSKVIGVPGLGMWGRDSDSVEPESFDVGDAKVQHYGLLMKKPFGHKSTRWQRR